MKINFIGNTCNYAFWWAKLIRELGFAETIAFIEKSDIPRDLPWWDDKSINITNIPEWIFMMPKVPFGGGIGGGNITNIINQKLRQCDLIHAFGGISAIWANRTNLPYVYQSYGDINTTPFVQNIWSLSNHVRSMVVKKVIREAKKIVISQLCDLKNAERFGLKSKMVLLPIIYDCEAVSATKAIDNSAMEEKYKNWELIFYSPSRHIPEKRQDKVIRCFAQFLKRKQIQACLILTEWGSLLDQSKKLINELGINEFTNWIPCQTKEGMMKYMRLPRVAVLDEFVAAPQLWSFGGISRDAMAMEAVLISRVSMDMITLLHKTAPPILWTDDTERSILERMLEFSEMNMNERKFLGYLERQWLWDEHHYENLLPRYFDIYRECMG